MVSKLQKTVGANTAGASRPELEEELQQEIAKIEPKVESGTVTKEEANHLRSRRLVPTDILRKAASLLMPKALQQRKLEASLSALPTTLRLTLQTWSRRRFDPAEQSHEAKEVDFESVVAAIKPKLEKSPDMVTREDANLIHSREVRAHGATEKGGVLHELSGQK